MTFVNTMAKLKNFGAEIGGSAESTLVASVLFFVFQNRVISENRD